VVTFDEELEAAKQAQTVISTLSISAALNSNDVIALHRAAFVAMNAITTFPSEGPLNEARHAVGIALPDLIRGPLTQAKIDNAKDTTDVWMVELFTAFEVAPVSWTPDLWSFRSPQWQESTRPMRRNSAGR
jgi:hypothetical protein